MDGNAEAARHPQRKSRLGLRRTGLFCSGDDYYYCALALSAAISASVRTVITPIWFER
jgi:hypothetical protein